MITEFNSVTNLQDKSLNGVFGNFRRSCINFFDDSSEKPFSNELGKQSREPILEHNIFFFVKPPLFERVYPVIQEGSEWIAGEKKYKTPIGNSNGNSEQCCLTNSRNNNWTFWNSRGKFSEKFQNSFCIFMRMSSTSSSDFQASLQTFLLKFPYGFLTKYPKEMFQELL